MSEITAANKGKVMDGFLMNLVAKVERTRTSINADQAEIKRIETEMKLLQQKMEKSNQNIESKKKIREETKVHLKELDAQFAEVL